MLELLANILVVLIGLYALVGIGFAIFFVWRGVGTIDAAAREGSWGFRLAILPGSAVLWPLLLGRYRAQQGPPIEHNAHRDFDRGTESTSGPPA